jgi:Tfp pilus assembly PilM family ATPase
MSLLSSLLVPPPAEAVVEIGPEAVSVASFAPRGEDALVQGCVVEPLPPGAVSAALLTPNIIEPAAVVARLAAAIERLASKPRRVALLLPDPAARVSLVKFEQVPARAEDLEQLVRWQVKKAAPFPIEDTLLSYMPAGIAPDGGHEFLVVAAKRDVVRGYESLCEALNMHAGLVDLSTFGVVNACLAVPGARTADWLVVHVRPAFTSVAIVRSGSVIFFRNLAGEDAATLVDVVHQTTMYYQDRLGGSGFSQVLLSGVGGLPGTLDDVRRNLEARLRIDVHRVDTARVVAFADRIGATPELLAWLAPLAGTWLRMRSEAVAA